jgi:hypothetical protein
MSLVKNTISSITSRSSWGTGQRHKILHKIYENLIHNSCLTDNIKVNPLESLKIILVFFWQSLCWQFRKCQCFITTYSCTMTWINTYLPYYSCRQKRVRLCARKRFCKVKWDKILTSSKFIRNKSESSLFQ